jgi:hypothetical protein
LDWVEDPTLQRNFDRISQELRQPVSQARVYNDANISVANTTLQALTFNSERFDHGDLHSTSVNTGRLTAPVAGLYMMGGCVQFASNATGVRVVQVRVGGSTVIANVEIVAGAATTHSLHVSAAYQLAAGDYAELIAYQTSGGSLNVLAQGNYSPEFWMVRLAGFESTAFTG